MEVSIVIVNWNSAAYTAASVSSIRERTQGLEYEIVVVDNASTDNSLEVLKQIGDIRLVVSSVNVGFARANNLGSQQTSGEVLLFLNPDTVVQGPAIRRMYCALLAHPSLGILGCKLLNTDLSLQTSCVQAFPTILNQLTDVEALRVRFSGARMWGISALFQDTLNPIPVEVVSGACLMIQRQVFDAAGMFSTDYFMYGEDVDLCYKVTRMGWRVAYLSQATVIHHGGQSSKKKTDTFFGDVATRETTRLFLAKTKGSTYAFAYRCSMSVAAMFRLIVLSVAVPSWQGKDEEGILATRTKWSRILRWSLGRESWVTEINGSIKAAPRSAPAEEI